MAVDVGYTGPEAVKGLTVSRERSRALLAADTLTACSAADRLVRVPLTTNRILLVSFVFNPRRQAPKELHPPATHQLGRLRVGRRAEGVVTVLDIDADMIDANETRAVTAHVENVRVDRRDFVTTGCRLPTESQSDALIFNLLHLDDPATLLREAGRVLKTNGRLWVMHWRSDTTTPRGPPLSMRSTPADCAVWMRDAGFRVVESVDLGLSCPYHYGLLGST